MPALSEISLYSADNNLASGAIIQNTEHNTHRGNVRDLFSDLLSYFSDLEQNFSSGSQPTDIDDGKIWYDSTSVVFKGRKASAWVEIVDVSATQTLTNKTLTSPTITSPTVSSLTITGDITATGGSIDFDLVDNNASALSFDASGKTGIINIITTDSSEGVSMSGTLSVTGSTTLAAVTASGNIESGDFIGINTTPSSLFGLGAGLVVESTQSSGNTKLAGIELKGNRSGETDVDSVHFGGYNSTTEVATIRMGPGSASTEGRMPELCRYHWCQHKCIFFIWCWCGGDG